MGRPEFPDGLEVVVKSYDREGRAAYISGHFQFNGTRFEFNGILMDGYGGPNVAVTLSDETLSSLRQLGLDNESIDELITSIQRLIMEGQAEIHCQPLNESPKE